MKSMISFAVSVLVATVASAGGDEILLPRGTPEAQGVSSVALLDLVSALDEQIEGMHSLMVVRHGNVIAEGWWRPYGAQHNHVLYSLSKSFTSSAVRPEPAVANGTAVVICPGGAFFMLSINSEGMDVAHALAAKGVTCFVLRYRLVETKTDDPAREVMSRGSLDETVRPIVPLAVADGQAAIGHIRENATKYGVNPGRIGIMGFSAGGTVASSVGFNYTTENRPDFVAPIYLAYSWTLKDRGVPDDAPPIFILAATDDPLGLASHSVDLYRDWTAAKKPAELHLFAKGGHGFGMNTQRLPTDGWIDRFADWLDFQGLLEK